MNNGITTWIVMVLVFLIGLAIGYVAGSNDVTPQGALQEIEDSITATSDPEAITTDTSNAPETNVTSEAPNRGGSGATTVDTSQLSPGQRQLLESLGVDTSSITITPEMIACAEAKVGAQRVAEIQNGATPTFMEG